MILRSTATALTLSFVLAPALQAQDWTGAYGGIQIGSARSGDEGIFLLDPLPPGGALETAFSPNMALPDRGFSGAFDVGAVGGVHFGYDWQVGNMVYGGVLDLNSADFGDVQEGRSRTPATVSYTHRDVYKRQVGRGRRLWHPWLWRADHRHAHG